MLSQVTRTLSRNTSTHALLRNNIIKSLSSSNQQFSTVVPGVGKGKTSTGLVGLPVDHDAIPKIIEKYQALLDKAQAMPETAQYRINIEKIARHRINAAKLHPDNPEKVEELCNCGQVEELVQQADDEMIVMDMYLRNRWWETVKEVEIEYAPMEIMNGIPRLYELYVV
mmetsp:Transcript_6482/g.12205  ORF Transcript_6482/g.12205 Transcript_6482/m.12205 type:complete len:169 (+) Transcript_6482:2672-3178(+)